jgi:nucleotide-binding universal stress UspA family protein
MTEAFSRILVALDLSDMDSLLIRQARKIAGIFRSKQVYFIHIIPDLTLPGNAQLEFRQRFAPEIPLDEQVKTKLRDVIKEAWGPEPGPAWSIDVIEGQPYRQLMRWLDVKRIGLLVIGQKQTSSGSGITARKLAGNVGCSVLFVPDRPIREGGHILVPVDFSTDSAKALKIALKWKLNHQSVQIAALHVTDLIAAGYYLKRQEFDTFNRFLADSASHAFHKFLEMHQFSSDDLEKVILRNEEGSISDQIANYAAEMDADWIILGAQGHGAMERFFFGSVSEKLVSKPLPAPTLVVR